MNRLASFALLAALVVFPRSASALQLHWNSGSSELSFAEATRCTLIVQAEPGVGHLPADWTLTWVSSGCEIRPVTVPSSSSCSESVAEVSSVIDPTTAADILSHAPIVRFCSAQSEVPAEAQWVFDLPAGCSGKLQVSALDPADPDSTNVLESAIATFNGGVEGPFAPVIFRTTTEHTSTEFRLSAVGSNLTDAHSLQLAAPDGAWSVPLTVTDASASQLSATASLAANVPASVFLANGDGGAGAALVEEDPPPPPLEPESGCQAYFVEDVYPPNTIQAKDFAFVPGGWTPSGSWTFHLFYIRHNQLPGVSTANTEKNLGHAVSNDLDQWTVLDTAAVKVRAGRFDSQHVWAPTIVRKGLTYYMFYTGADDGQNQRIGLATSNDLITWVQTDSVLSASQVPWADPSPGPPYGGEDQLRDPFVMEDPAVPGGWLMYFVTVPSQYSPGMVAGLAKSPGDFHTWNQIAPLWATLRPYTGATGRVESPHMFFRNNKWWLFSTMNHVGFPDSAHFDTVYAVSNASSPSSPSDTVTANWTAKQPLQNLVPPSEGTAYNFWHATEYLNISEASDIHYLAAFNDAQVGISYTQMRATDPPTSSKVSAQAQSASKSLPLQFWSPGCSSLGRAPQGLAWVSELNSPRKRSARSPCIMFWVGAFGL